MKCNNCGNEFEGNFCGRCGTKLDVQENNNNFRDKESLLIDPTENIKSVLGNNCIQSFLSTGQLGNGFAILTDKRIYFKGKCFFRKGKGFYSKTEEKTVDLKDITGTGFVHNKATWAKIVSIILFWYAIGMSGMFLLSGIVFHILINGEPFSDASIDILIGPAIFFALHFIFKFIYNRYNYSVFEISYAGGGIAFDMHWITQQESKEFQQQLVLLKQNEKKKEQSHSFDYFKQENLTSIPQQLKEYKDLLDNGIITQEEFNCKKKELLNK